MASRGIRDDQFTVTAATPADVPSYLSAADAGLSFIKPCFSKLASSPTKYAEYLGCGLPLIINSGIGDSDALITREKVGALVSDFHQAAYDGAWQTIMKLAGEPELARARAKSLNDCSTCAPVGVERMQLYTSKWWQLNTGR
jgi:hypothetical protein